MSEGTIEHRKNFRPPAPLPGLSARMDAVMEMLAKRRQWNVIAHAVVFGFTLLCVGAVWWSIAVRLPQLERTSEELQQLNRAYNQLEQLKLKQDRRIDVGLARSMARHERELFAHKRELVDWLHTQIELAHQQGIRMRYALGGERRALITHHAMDVQLHFSLDRADDGHGYARLLRFISRMRHHGVALHVEHAVATGGGRGLSSLDLGATVWMR